MRKAHKAEVQAKREADERAEQGLAPIGSFEHSARELYTTRYPEKGTRQWGDAHAKKWIGALKRHVFPWIGCRMLADLKPSDILPQIRRLEAAGHTSMSQDVREYIGQVFMWGIAHERCEMNPVTSLKLVVQKHVAEGYAAVLEPKVLGRELLDIDGYSGTLYTRVALQLQLQLLLFQRPGITRTMLWSELDLDEGM